MKYPNMKYHLILLIICSMLTDILANNKVFRKCEELSKLHSNLMIITFRVLWTL